MQTNPYKMVTLGAIVGVVGMWLIFQALEMLVGGFYFIVALIFLSGMLGSI